jgi:hypothetical protein
MEFMNRGASQPAAPARATNSSGVVHTPSTGTGNGKKTSQWSTSPMWLRVVWVVLLFSGTILVAALAALMYFGGPNESNYIDKSKQQAVFLTNGQVYFGKIKSVNEKFLDLRNIYYLNVNQQVQPNQSTTNQQNQQAQNNVSLVKLGCELHGPLDRMIINRDQITFWENLKDDGQVTKAIAEWVKQNPNGQTCQAKS